MSLSRKARIRLLALLTIGAALYIFRAPILRAAAHGWIIDEPAIPAQAIVVLGGGEDYRPFAAAELYKKGIAPIILVPKVELDATQTLGLRPTTTQIILGVLNSQRIPDPAIQLYADNVGSTRDEAVGVQTWVAAQNPPLAPAVLVIPTDPFATRRTNAFFEKTLPNLDIRVLVTTPKDIDVETWWTQERSLISFQNEVIKWAFYKVKY